MDNSVVGSKGPWTRMRLDLVKGKVCGKTSLQIHMSTDILVYCPA